MKRSAAIPVAVLVSAVVLVLPQAAAAKTCAGREPGSGRVSVSGQTTCGESAYVIRQARLHAPNASVSHYTVTVAPALGPWRCTVRFGDEAAHIRCVIPKSSVAYRRDHRRGGITVSIAND